jgi:hypothetical protein
MELKVVTDKQTRRWQIILFSTPVVLGTVIWWLLFLPPAQGRWVAEFPYEKTGLYRGYPLRTEQKQWDFLEKTNHKSAMNQPFYTEPVVPTVGQYRALATFLRDGSVYYRQYAPKDCGFHADVLLESSSGQALICTGCGDIWITFQGARKVLAVRTEKIPKLKQLVFDILGKPAEWPPELED